MFGAVALFAANHKPDYTFSIFGSSGKDSLSLKSKIATGDLPYGLVTSLALRIRAFVGRFEPCPVHIRPSSVPVPLRWFVPADLSVGSLSSWG